ncbi:MAG: hypothetical protein AB7G93_04195 [Bdellovibrionales bacterium]
MQLTFFLKRFLTLGASALLIMASQAVLAQGAGETRTFPELPGSTASAGWHPSVGLRGGYADLNEGYDDAFAYGVESNLVTWGPLMGGLAASRYETEEALTDLERTSLMAQMAYRLGGTIPVVRDSFIGLGAGAVWDDVNGDLDTEFGLEPSVGFDIPIQRTEARYFTLGAMANYLILPADNEDNPESVALNGTVKYWF